MTEPPKLSLHLLIVALALVFVGAAGAAGPQSAKECQEGSPMGASYLGKDNVTASGLNCQAWSSSKPHEHQYDEVGDHNFCRNPDSSWDGGVWCYTTDPNKRWEVCSVPVCAAKHNCRQAGDPLGADYSGDTSVTASGLTCQAWAASEPHKHAFKEVGDHNHCRNPDGFSGGVWCYTTDPGKRWEVCDVPTCQDRHENQEGEEGNKGIRILFFGLFTVKKSGVGAVLNKETRKSRHIIAVACHTISSIRICWETPV